MLGKRDIQPKSGGGRIKLRDSEKVMAVSPIGFAKRSGQRVGKGLWRRPESYTEKAP